MALALIWQWLVVHGYFHGQWSGLFFTGDRFTQSPPVRAESPYLLPNYGYDGQFYHAIAHDPLDLRGTDRFIDNPHVRYSRVFLPAVSYALGFGRVFWIDRAYRGLELAFLFLGVFCAGVWAEGRGQRAWLGAAFVLLPGVFISLERQLTDLALCALLAAAMASHDRGRQKLCWISLACAGLVREMGFAAIAGFVLSAARQKKFKEAGQWCLAALPGALWNAYVLMFIPSPAVSPLHPALPLLPILRAMAHLQQYPLSAAASLILHSLDRAALFGLLLSFALSLPRGIRQTTPLASAGIAFMCFGIAASGTSIMDYTDVYSFGRQNSSLLMIQLFQAMESGSASLLWPLALLLPRSLVPGGSMTLRAIRDLAGSLGLG